MVMNGFDTDGDGANNFYTVNGLAFYYAKYPIRVRRSQTVRIYLANLTEFDLDQLVPPARRLLPLLPDRLERSLRVHGHRDALPGTARDHRDRLRATPGTFMFHAHQSEFTELGWMGFFEVVD